MKSLSREQIADTSPLNPLTFSHASMGCLIFERDLKKLLKSIHELDKSVRIIENRFVHKETTQVSKSFFDYVQKKDMLIYNPQLFYDFKFGDVRICIGRTDKLYCVYCFGWNPFRYGYIDSTPNIYCNSSDIDECIEKWQDMVHKCLAEKLSYLF